MRFAQGAPRDGCQQWPLAHPPWHRRGASLQLTDRPFISPLNPAVPSASLLRFAPLPAAEHDERVQGAIAEASAAGVKLHPSQEVLDLIRSADAFTFDVDSTL